MFCLLFVLLNQICLGDAEEEEQVGEDGGENEADGAALDDEGIRNSFFVLHLRLNFLFLGVL